MAGKKEKWLNNVRVNLSPTNKCNYRCKHCLVEKYSGEMDVNIVIEIIKDLKENLNIEKINFSGGEVFLYKDFYKITNYCHDCGVGVGFVTNGSLIDETSIEWLCKIKPRVCLSLDGPRNFHNSFRNNAKSFDRVIRAISILENCDITPSIYFSCLKENYKYIDWIIQFCVDHRINQLRIQPVEYCGHAKENYSSDDMLNSREKIEFLKKIVDVSGKYIGILFINTTSKFRKQIVEHPCTIGAHYWSECHSNVAPQPSGFDIQPYGQVYPYSNLINKQYVVGNVHNKSISSIISDYYMSPKHINFLNLLKYIQINKYVNGIEGVINFETDLYEMSNIPIKKIDKFFN